MNIQEIVSATHACPRCHGMTHPDWLEILHCDDPAPGENATWAYQDKPYDTIIITFKCACEYHSLRQAYFTDSLGNLYLSPFQNAQELPQWSNSHARKPLR